MKRDITPLKSPQHGPVRSCITQYFLVQNYFGALQLRIVHSFVSILVIYCCVTILPQSQQFTKHTFIISPFLWVRTPSTAQLHLLFQGFARTQAKVSARSGVSSVCDRGRILFQAHMVINNLQGSRSQLLAVRQRLLSVPCHVGASAWLLV